MRAPGRLRGVALLGGGTVLAALFGVAFQALLANWFGADAETDAWFMSLSIYAFLAKFLMLTHLKSIALPVYRRLRDRDPAEGRRLAVRLLAWSAGGVALLSALLVVAAPLLVDLLAPGYRGELRELTVALVRIRTPALAFLAAATAGLVVLESAHRFGVTVLAQKIVPAAVMLLLFLVVRDGWGMVGVAWIGLAGSVAGGLLAVVMLWPSLRAPRREGSPQRPAAGAAPPPGSVEPASAPSLDARRELRGIAGQWVRFSGSNAATFAGEWAFRVAASLLPAGLFSAVLYGRMVHDLLHGAVNDAAQTVSLPRFAAAASGEDQGAGTGVEGSGTPGADDRTTADERVGPRLRESLGALAAVNLPVAAFVAVTAPWSVALLFGRGAFLADGMLEPAALALRIFALGFLLQGLNQLLFAAAFASERSRLVNRVQIVGHLARAVALVPAALAFSFVGLVGAQVAMNALVLALLLGAAPPAWGVGWARVRRSLAAATGRGILAATALLLGAWLLGAGALPDPLALGTAGRAGVLVLLAAGWFGAYVGLASAFGVAPVRAFLGRVPGWARPGTVALGLVMASAAAGAAPGALDAQIPVRASGGAVVGGAPVAAGHWSRRVLELLEARGALPAGAARAGPLTGTRIEALLTRAADRAVTGPALLRLRDELGARGPLGPLAGSVMAGARTAPEGSRWPEGALLVTDLRLGDAGGPWSAAAEVESGAGAAERALRRASVGVRLGAVSLHVGRHRVQLGGGGGGALVLSPSASLDGLLLLTDEPWTLPAVGATTVTAGVFELDRAPGVESPWFGLLRLAVAPAPWLAVGVSRAAQVGGRFEGGTPPFDPAYVEGDEESMDAGDVLGILAGRVTGYDNQLFSLDARVSLASAGLPLQLQAEVALEDNERSWGDGAVHLGALLAPRTRVPLALRYEYVGVGDPGRWCAWCDTLPAFWYQHTRFQGGWRVGEELLGHPLGGYGLQHRLEVGLYDPGMALRSRVAVVRQRRDAFNLLEPTRAGWSWGLQGRLSVALESGLEARARAELEWGDDGWRAGRAEAGLALLAGGG